MTTTTREEVRAIRADRQHVIELIERYPRITADETQDVITFLKPSSSEAEREAIIRKYGVTVLVIPADHPGLNRQLDQDPLLEQRLHVPGAGHGWEIYSVRQPS